MRLIPARRGRADTPAATGSSRAVDPTLDPPVPIRSLSRPEWVGGGALLIAMVALFASASPYFL